MRKICELLLVFSMPVFATSDVLARDAKTASRSESERAFCNSEFQKIIEGNMFASSPEKVAAWRKLEPRCSGTGLYESRLVGLMTYSGQVDEARKVGLKALEKPLDSKRELLVALAEVETHAENFGLAIDYSKRAIDADRDWFGGYGSLGEILLDQKKYPQATEALEAAFERDRNVNVAASLSIAYWGSQRYEESARAMQAAIEADESTLRYTKAIAAAAESMAQIGETERARALLARHRELVPASINDIDFVRSVKFVAAALKAAKSQ